jgi:MoCo/4Fe-4S cofactor protein with predicted Tat translocation signal
MSNEKKYFRSPGEFAQTEDFKANWEHREFPPQASEAEGVSRREFVKMMAGGLALTALTGCRRPESHIVPLNEQPEHRVVGKPVFYASAEPRAQEAIPLIVETHEGRPTKLEGNAQFAPFAGATDMQAQAYILDLYEADRATKSYIGGATATPAQVRQALAAAAAQLQETQGEGTVVLAHTSVHPTDISAQADFLQKYPRARWVSYSAFATDRFALALEPLTGQQLMPRYELAKADVILTLDADLVGRERGSIHYARAFAARRKADSAFAAQQMNRLYAVEAEMTLTGAQADHRLRLSDSELTAFAARLLAEIETLSGQYSPLHAQLSEAPVSERALKWLQPMARDLWRARGHALVACGSHQPLALQLITLAINQQLQAIGSTFILEAVPTTLSHELSDLSSAQRLILFGVNPAYDAPAELGWQALVARVGARNILRYAYRYDETSLSAPELTQVLAAHPLESWGLCRAFNGALLAQQPMVMPLFGGMEPLEFWAQLTGSSATSRDLTARAYAQLTGQAGAQDFNNFLNRGVATLSYSSAAAPSAAAVAQALAPKLDVAYALAQKAQHEGSLELLLRPSYTVGTGDAASNGWRQECPDPITKITWGNTLLISPSRARDLGYDPLSDSWLPIAARKLATLDRGRQTAPLATVEVDGRRLRIPLTIQPGLPDNTAILHLGYGHTKFGRNADGVGIDAFPLIRSSGLYTFFCSHISVATTTELMANTQNHWSIEGRDHYREGTVADFLAQPTFAQKMGIEAHAPNNYGKDAAMPLHLRSKETPRGNSAFDHPNFTAPQQWGMSIDLSACNGCNACVIACQAENNIPIVGRDQILRGREMHWIRIDRYYASGDSAANKAELPSEVEVALQPMLCQHCERAPCEQVCPVNATLHDEQGLNVMAYNRCVGTRYCANNCPYKVRRFNFFNYNKRDRDHYYWGMFGPDSEPEILKLQRNPDVTVRSRGVMEKCTFCVQRIEQAKIRQKIIAKDSDNILVPDGVIRTACQQACPTQAIAFGDIADPQSAISQLKASPRDYSALGYLNTRPRLTYLARLRNPNPQMPDYRPLYALPQRAGGRASRQRSRSCPSAITRTARSLRSRAPPP